MPGFWKVMTRVCAPVGAFAGMVKVASTVPDVASDRFVPLMVPARVALVMGALAGGAGGFEGSVMLTVTVVPRVTVPPGALTVAPPPPLPLVPKVVVPAP